MEGDDELGLEAATGRSGLVVADNARDGDGKSADPLEGSVLVPDEILGRDAASGHSVAKGVHLDGLMDLKVALSEENVEVGVLLERDVDRV